jgi:hypothetical protein
MNIMNMTERREPKKRAYQKPELTQVELRPEEAVLGNCKPTGGGPGSGNCATPSACSTPGS